MIHDDSEGKHITRRCIRFRLSLLDEYLRRHKQRSTDYLIHLIFRIIFIAFSETKVDNLESASLFVDENVLGFEVPVDYPVGMDMHNARQDHVHKMSHFFLRMQHFIVSSLSNPVIDYLLQLNSILHQLHDQVHIFRVIVALDVLYDMPVVQQRQDRYFLLHNVLFLQ